MIAAAGALVAASLTAAVSPSVAARDGQIRVVVTGLSAPAASVVVHGGIASEGKMFGWVALRSSGAGSWWTVLRAPGFLGVYPVQVRAGGILRQTGAVVSVLPRGFAAQPAFDKPAQVAEWWSRQAPAGTDLLSVTTWHAGFFTHRDPTLNRLLRVRFTLLGDWKAKRLARGTYTRWFSVARTSAQGQWRLLEIVEAP
jgi:hypothetical protein